MKDEDDIPLLNDLIRETTTPGADDLPADNGDDKDMIIDLESDERPTRRRADTLPQAIGKDGELDTLDPLAGDSSLRELIVEEQIRLILDKHMEAAYEEILQLIQHKIR